jgi:23S rRNA pseudouridine2457 synthase
MISQFVSPYRHRLLGDLEFTFPPGTNAVGRLDDDSEGLLILTNDKTLTRTLLHPSRMHKRRYLVQVEREIKPETVNELMNGVDILVKKKGMYRTVRCEVNVVTKPLGLAERAHSFRESLPQSWLEFILTEGKNRQIRKMCSAVRHDCKRLIRTAIEDLELGDMKPGEVREIEKEQLFTLLKLENTGITPD